MKKVKIYFLCFLVAVFANELSFAQNSAKDSLLVLLKTDKEDSNKVNHLNTLSSLYFEINNDSSLKHSQNALLLATKLVYLRGIADAYYNIGLGYRKESNYPLALKNHELSLKFGEKLQHKATIAKACNGIGIIHTQLGNYTEAIKKFYTALQIGEELKDKNILGAAYFSIGITHLYQNHNTESINYFLTALTYKEELKDKEGVADVYNNIGIAYINEGNYEAALKSYTSALKINQELGLKSSTATSYNNIALVYDYQENYGEAIRNYEISLMVSKAINDKYNIAISCANLAGIYTQLRNTKKAELYYEKALKINVAAGNKYLIQMNYAAWLDLDTLTKNYKSAYEHQSLFMKYGDSLNNEATNKKLIQSQMQYEFDKKDAETKFQNNEAVKKLEADNKIQKLQRLFLVCVIFVILVLLFFAKRAHDNRKKYLQILSKDNEHKEVLLQEVHHRVNNSLQLISSLLSIQADTTANEKIKEYLLNSQNRIHAMSSMHQLLHIGNSTLEVNINTYLTEIINFYKNVLESKPGIQLNTEIPPINFNTKIALPLALIVNELITNSIKYAFPTNEGEINILLFLESTTNQWHLNIRDNGRGFSETEKNAKESSLGLSIVTLMTRQIGGQMKINSLNGVLFELTFNSNR